MRSPPPRRPWSSLLAMAALLVSSVATHATTVKPLNVVDLLEHSQTIVAGQVERVVDGFDSRGLPYTEVTLRVSDTIRGDKAGTYTFRQFGLDKPRTLPDGTVYLGRPAGWPTWRRGESALVFMYPKARQTGLQTTVGLGQGKLSVGNGVAMNAQGNQGLFAGVRLQAEVLDEPERKLLETEQGPVDEKALRKFLHRAVDGNWVRKGSLRHEKH